MRGIFAELFGSGMYSATGNRSVTLSRRMASCRTVLSFLEIGFVRRPRYVCVLGSQKKKKYVATMRKNAVDKGRFLCLLYIMNEWSKGVPK